MERAGRVCYKSEGNIKEGSAETFIRGILKRGHESVVEHGSITVRIVCDRGRDPMRLCATELPATVRRAPGTAITPMRKFGSQITCIDLASGFQYDLNDEKDRRKYEIWKKAMEEAERYYFDLLEAGAKPEEARSILPNSLKTENCCDHGYPGVASFYPAAGRSCRASADPGNYKNDSGGIFQTVPCVF